MMETVMNETANSTISRSDVERLMDSLEKHSISLFVGENNGDTGFHNVGFVLNQPVDVFLSTELYEPDHEIRAQKNGNLESVDFDCYCTDWTYYSHDRFEECPQCEIEPYEVTREVTQFEFWTPGEFPEGFVDAVEESGFTVLSSFPGRSERAGYYDNPRLVIGLS